MEIIHNTEVQLRAPESFFDDYPEFKMNLYPVMEEIKLLAQEPSEICRDYFYRCLAEPRIHAMIVSQPFAEAAITTRLVNVLNNFKSKIGALIEECGAEIKATLREQMKEIDFFYGQEKPYFEALLTRRVQPFADYNRRGRSNAAFCQVNAVVRDLIWQPASDIQDAPAEPQNVCQYLDSEEDRSSQHRPEEEPLDIMEIKFRSSKPAIIIPQLSTMNFTCRRDLDKSKAIEDDTDKLLTDAYKVASDIKHAIPTLSDKTLQLSKAKLKSYCELIKHSVTTMTTKIEAYLMKNTSRPDKQQANKDMISPLSVALRHLINISASINTIIVNHLQYYTFMFGSNVMRPSAGGEAVCITEDIDAISDHIDKCLIAMHWYVLK